MFKKQKQLSTSTNTFQKTSKAKIKKEPTVDNGKLVLLKPSAYIVEHKGDDCDVDSRSSLIVIDSPTPALLIEAIATPGRFDGKAKECYSALLNGKAVIVWDDMIMGDKSYAR